jgi:hypothetical protein
VFIRGEICFAQSNHRLWIGGLICLSCEMSARQGRYLATARSLDNAVTGLGSEMIMRVPQTEQFTQPACSTTEGTVLNLRMHLGHWTSTIWTNWRP